MWSEQLDVVVPMYRTAAHLPELLRRLEAAVPGAHVVLVDDRCPERSGDLAASATPASLALTVVWCAENIGQHAAVLLGLAHATAPFVAVMDADLQDAPEALPDLVHALQAAPEAPAVCAARSGRYTSAGRRWTARAYRVAARLLSRGRIPAAAGMFMVGRREAMAAVLRLGDPMVPLVPGLAAAGARLVAVPVERHRRDLGSSAHRSRDRLTIAMRGLAVLTPAAGLLASRHRRRLAHVGPPRSIAIPPAERPEPRHG